MKNIDFIKKYGTYNLESICDSVRDNLIVLYYNKKIPKYKLNKRKKQVKFYLNNKFTTFDVAELFYMSDKRIIKELEKRCE